jgi:hypothetical protein
MRWGDDEAVTHNRPLVLYQEPDHVVKDTFKRLAPHVVNQFGTRIGSHLASIAANRELDRVEPRNELAMAQQEYMARASGRNFAGASRMMNQFDDLMGRTHYGVMRFPGSRSVLEDQANEIMSNWPNNNAEPIPAVVYETIMADTSRDPSLTQDLLEQVEFSRPLFLKRRKSDRLYDTDKRAYYAMLQDRHHPLYDHALVENNALYPDLQGSRIAAQYSASDLFPRRLKRVGKSWYYRTFLPKLRQQVHDTARQQGVPVRTVWQEMSRGRDFAKYRTPEAYAYMVRDGSIVDVLRTMKLNPYQRGVRA